MDVPYVPLRKTPGAVRFTRKGIDREHVVSVCFGSYSAVLCLTVHWPLKGEWGILIFDEGK